MEWFFLGRSRSGVGAGVGVDIFRPESESEPESLKIHRLHSPDDDTSKYTSVCKKKNRKTRPTPKRATQSRHRIASTVGLVSARKHPADGADTS